MEIGTVFKIQRFSIHDGPGIRTTVFLKGCPLSCWWCHNPEGIDKNKSIIYHREKCLHCNKCEFNCPENTIQIINNKLVVNTEKCTKCYKCVDVCPGNALELIGKTMSTGEIIDIVNKDVIFYDESNGGVTFSGGEPFEQSEFLLEALKFCRKEGIHTAVDTTGYSAWNRLKEIGNYTDLFLYDIKFFNEEQHKKYTGVSNKSILKNLELLSEIHENINIRFPLIPGLNDEATNLEQTIEFLKKTRIRNINILPYHSIGTYKYKRLNIIYHFEELREPTLTETKKVADLFVKNGFQIKIGG